MKKETTLNIFDILENTLFYSTSSSSCKIYRTPGNKVEKIVFIGCCECVYARELMTGSIILKEIEALIEKYSPKEFLVLHLRSTHVVGQYASDTKSRIQKFTSHCKEAEAGLKRFVEYLESKGISFQEKIQQSKDFLGGD